MPQVRRSNIGRHSRNARRLAVFRARSSQEEREEPNSNRQRSSVIPHLNLSAKLYDSTVQYSELPCVKIGQMDVVCPFCSALKFRSETPGLCCVGGRVKLHPLTPPPEPLRSLLYGDLPESKHFLKNVQKYNGCFQMTSFGANIVDERGFNPTFKVIFFLFFFE